MGFPAGSDGKESACSVGDLCLIPGIGRSPGEGNGNQLQHCGLENPMDRGACRAIVYGVARSQTQLSDFQWGHYPRGNLAPDLDSTGKALDWVNLFHVHIQ